MLTDPVLRVERQGSVMRLSLPELLAALGEDEVDSLPGLQLHQEDGWHVFLSYLAATVLARSGERRPSQRAAYWEDGLRELAGSAGDDAWRLVVPDTARPAFMQPPLPPGDARRLKDKAATPDELDLLVTSKNHDVKAARASQADVDEWVYALVNVQTMSGYLGAGNRGIARMNSGFGNRLIVELVRSFRMGRRFSDAVVRLLEHRERLLEEAYGYDPNGLALLWVVVWDGSTLLPLRALDPFFIEICRRIRLVSVGDGIRARDVSASADRVDAKDLAGAVGDPWLPVDEGKRSGKEATVKALTISADGLTAETMRRLVFRDGLVLTGLQDPGSDWGRTDVWLSASVLVRGQGKTEGFHHEVVHVPGKVVPRLFGPPEARRVLADLSRNGLEEAGKMAQVLRRATMTYLQGGNADVDRKSVDLWWRRASRSFERLWRPRFFPWLWDHAADEDLHDALTTWALGLKDAALRVLRDVEEGWPHRAGRSYQSKVAAERAFYGMLYSSKYFPWLKEERVHNA